MMAKSFWKQTWPTPIISSGSGKIRYIHNCNTMRRAWGISLTGMEDALDNELILHVPKRLEHTHPQLIWLLLLFPLYSPSYKLSRTPEQTTILSYYNYLPIHVSLLFWPFKSHMSKASHPSGSSKKLHTTNAVNHLLHHKMLPCCHPVEAQILAFIATH